MNWVKRIIDFICVLGKSGDKPTEIRDNTNSQIGNNNNSTTTNNNNINNGTIKIDNRETYNDSSQKVENNYFYNSEPEYVPCELDYAIRDLLLKQGEIYCGNLNGSLSSKYENWKIESAVERLVKRGYIKYLDKNRLYGRITKGKNFDEICK